MKYSRRELMQMLIGKNEADAELAQLGDRSGEGERREVLELINVDEEWAASREQQLRP